MARHPSLRPITEGGEAVTTPTDRETGYCSSREDETHCNHWWDGEACCNCGSLGMTDEQKREQGMLDEGEKP
jgi:hypothetical protein